MENKSGTLAALVILGFLSYSTAMQCFVCNSHFQKDCTESPVPDKYLVTCNSSNYAPVESASNGAEVRVSTTEGVKFKFCRKVVTKVPRQDNGLYVREETTRTVRSCGYVDKGNSVCKWANNHGVQMLMCECDKDQCNSAYKTFIPATLTLFIVALTAGLYK